MGRVMFLTVAAGPEGGGSRKSTIKMPKKVLFPDCDRLLRVFFFLAGLCFFPIRFLFNDLACRLLGCQYVRLFKRITVRLTSFIIQFTVKLYNLINRGVFFYACWGILIVHFLWIS